jgi:hypothetical protein
MGQTFNSANLPAGEAGLTGGFTSGWRDTPAGRGSLRGEFKSYSSGGANPNGLPWRWATLRELTDAGIPEAEARTMVHRSQLPEAQEAPPPPSVREDWSAWNDGDPIPAYDRVDIIRVAAGIKGASLSQIDNVATVSQYWGPGSFVRKWRPALMTMQIGDPNAKMINRDGGVTKRYWSDVGSAATYAKTLIQAYERDRRDSAFVVNAFTEHGSDHRLGLWGNYSL